jgi:hypothetical protein
MQRGVHNLAVSEAEANRLIEIAAEFVQVHPRNLAAV